MSIHAHSCSELFTSAFKRASFQQTYVKKTISVTRVFASMSMIAYLTGCTILTPSPVSFKDLGKAQFTQLNENVYKLDYVHTSNDRRVQVEDVALVYIAEQVSQLAPTTGFNSFVITDRQFTDEQYLPRFISPSFQYGMRLSNQPKYARDSVAPHSRHRYEGYSRMRVFTPDDFYGNGYANNYVGLAYQTSVQVRPKSISYTYKLVKDSIDPSNPASPTVYQANYILNSLSARVGRMEQPILTAPNPTHSEMTITPTQNAK